MDLKHKISAMGDFRRQPSKVWWSTYEDEDLSKFSGYLGWGKGIDLSANFTDSINNNLTSVKTALNSSKPEKTSESLLDKNSGSFCDKENAKAQAEMSKSEKERESLESDRGSSSSPSQGSHKSQDSGFSDSEIQNNALSLSPQCSPELSARLSCMKCQSREESKSSEPADNSKNEKSYNETVVNYRKLKTSVKSAPCKVVQFEPETHVNKEKDYLETAFDGREDSPLKKDSKNPKSLTKEDSESVNGGGMMTNVNSPKQKNRKNLLKSHISRTKNDTREKLNQIQNQLELSFKLPKKINLSPNLKIPNIFSSQCPAKSQDETRTGDPGNNTTRQRSSDSISSLKSVSCVSGNEKIACKPEIGDNIPVEAHRSSLDKEGFKVPKLPAEQSIRGTNNHLLDFTEIGGPPISSSTPKSGKFQGQESPVPRAARATEKKSSTKTTFATIRKLKVLPDKKFKGPVNLLNSFNRCSSTGSFPEKGKPLTHDFESSVKHWLSELETMYEAEIMTTLQSKSLAVDLTRQVTNMADTTSQTVRKLHQKTKIISSEFSKVCQQNKNKRDKQIGPLIQSLVGHITEFIREYVEKKDLVPQNGHPDHQRKEAKSQRDEEEEEEEEEDEDEVNDENNAENCTEMITDFRQPEPETVEVKRETTTATTTTTRTGCTKRTKTKTKAKEEEVLKACEKLRKLSAQRTYDHEKIESEVTNLGQKFTEVVDVLLESHIQALVRVLEEPRTELALRTALSALTSLGLEGNTLGHLVVKCGGIRALLAVCLEARATAVRVSALRALATVCCVSETIRQFEQAGGVEILADILADEKRSEAELSEASAVIAQITAPWVQDNHSVEGLSQFLNSLVTSLTRIVNKYKSCETLLLSSAALANLTFMEPRTVWPLLENETAKILLSAVRRQGPKVSVFIQEQAATVIANMASIPECRKHLAEQRAVVALLCFLQIHHSPLQRAPEIAAAERVQQKSAIALSRLCSDAMVAKQVVELQGVNRLVRLCKEERERNHSDGVLVACLAALRKIVANCGTAALEELDAMELVEPRLLDSFLLYSSKQESYV